uniref:DNA polymerase alpha subunit B n=1 Tax=Heterosigma akashiwo TaxID=2829 RepID=A0A7S3URV2_HETAK
MLCGPFVDEDHPQVAAGAPKLEAEGGAEETVDAHTLFAARVSEKLRAFYAAGGAGAQRTRVALVPSPRDAFHDAAFPQPPFADKVEGGVPNPFYEGDTLGTLDIPFSAGLEKRVHCVPNPATLSLNEVTIGVTSNDVLFDISSNSVMINAGNRMAKLAELLIQQQSYYPVYPPPERMEAKLDLRHAAKWRMPVTPDVLVVPSRLAYFAKNVGGVLCLNPGFLAKGAGAGTYAEVTVHPAPRDQLEKVQPQSKAIPARVAERTVVEIKRI